jgi:outer membrane protein assembly factor BamE (lipoprotein component of BamABCDE complex)
MTIRKWKSVGVGLICLIVLACAHAEKGRKFDTAAANQIEVGKTTEAEVLASLGQPLARKINADGTKVYGYAYAKAQAMAFSSKRVQGQGDKIIIKFDKNGVVSSLNQGSTGMKAGPGLGD